MLASLLAWCLRLLLARLLECSHAMSRVFVLQRSTRIGSIWDSPIVSPCGSGSVHVGSGSVHVDWGQSMLDWGQSMWIGVWTDNPIVYTRARTGTIMVYWCVIFNLACRWLLRILAIFFTLGGHSSSKKQQSTIASVASERASYLPGW